MKILLAEDQAMVRGALAALLSLGGFADITQAEDGEQALQLLKQHALSQQPFDLLLTDIEMPGRTGLELAQWLRDNQGDASPKTKVIVLTTFGRAGYIKRALEAGVNGFLLKDAPSDDLIHAIKQVMAGKPVIAPELAVLAIGDIDPLNDKERRAARRRRPVREWSIQG